MKLKNLIPARFRSSRVKHVSGQSFADVLRLIDQTGPISVDGYIKKAETKDFVLFSPTPQADQWTQISVRRISELEHLGQEAAKEGLCDRVRLTF
jgi:hypothetical protein